MSPADPLPSLVNAPHVAFGTVTHAQSQMADRALSALLTLDSPGFEAFRILRTKLKTLGEERPLRSFGLVSSVPQEGTIELREIFPLAQRLLARGGMPAVKFRGRGGAHRRYFLRTKHPSRKEL